MTYVFVANVDRLDELFALRSNIEKCVGVLTSMLVLGYRPIKVSVPYVSIYVIAILPTLDSAEGDFPEIL